MGKRGAQGRVFFLHEFMQLRVIIIRSRRILACAISILYSVLFCSGLFCGVGVLVVGICLLANAKRWGRGIGQA